MMLLLLCVLSTLSCCSSSRHSHHFHADEQLREHKETSPILSDFLKRGRLSKKDFTSYLRRNDEKGFSSLLPSSVQKNQEVEYELGGIAALKEKGTSIPDLVKHKEGLREMSSSISSSSSSSASSSKDMVSPSSSRNVKLSRIPGDVFYFFGTLLDLEYVSCEDGTLADDLSDEQNNQLVSAKGYVLGECNPYEPSRGASTMLTATVNVFLETMILHEITYENVNCTGVNVTTNTNYPGPSECLGNSKYFVTTSLTLHEEFPLLEDKLFALRTTQPCSTRDNLLYFAAHNTSYHFFNSDMCWTYNDYTVSIEEGGGYDPQLATTIVTKQYEPFDDKTCAKSPVLVEGWVVDRCEPLSEEVGVKSKWTNVGEKDGHFYIGVQTYGTYDCSGNVTGTSVLDMGRPDTCYHNIPVPWMINQDASASYADHSRDSHSEYYGGQICNEEHIFMWKTADTECTKDTNTDYHQCLTYNHYSEDDGDDIYNDDFAVELKSQEIFCRSQDESDEVCFHADTVIDYKGVEYTYTDLLGGKEAECTVPHSPISIGVIITTSCGKSLRVTDTHLVATARGFKLAYALKEGDVLFEDYSDVALCEVKTVEKERSQQQYFGLNCVHSEVLASGLRVSTFGDFHTLPSWFMSYVGGILGSTSASQLGEYIVAEWYRG